MRIFEKDLHPGKYWGWEKSLKDYELLDVEENDKGKLVGFVMGWDCSVPLDCYEWFEPAEIVKPNGSKWL